MCRSSSSRQSGQVGTKELIAGARVGVPKTHRCEKHDSELSITGTQEAAVRDEVKGVGTCGEAK